MANDIAQDINRKVVEMINEESLPHINSETWACNCGKVKTNHHEEPSISSFMKSIASKETS